MLRPVTVDAPLCPLGLDERLAGLEGATETAHDLLGARPFIEAVHDLDEPAPEHTAGNVPDRGARHGIELAEYQIRIHETHADGGVLEQRMKLVRMSHQRTLGPCALQRDPGSLCGFAHQLAARDSRR